MLTLCAGNFLSLPKNRVRQICALDDEFTLIEANAVTLLTKAAEMFVTDLASTCGYNARYQKRKTLVLNDIVNVAKHNDKFHFLKDS